MSGQRVGVARAPIRIAGQKTKYVTLGPVIKDGERLAIYIETLPRDMANWTGWINIFFNEEEEEEETGATTRKTSDNDIPF